MSETEFQRAINDPNVPKLFDSGWHGVAAIIDTFPRLPYQSLAIPYRPFKENERVLGDMLPIERLSVVAVGHALQRKVQDVCAPGQFALTHTEGYDVPKHAHILVYQSYRQKSGAELYGGPILPDWPVERTLAALSFNTLERDALLWELDRIHRGFAE